MMKKMTILKWIWKVEMKMEILCPNMIFKNNNSSNRWLEREILEIEIIENK